MPELRVAATTLYYEQAGEGADLVWLAGGDQTGAEWHEYQVSAFPDFRNTVYDARGVGQTTCAQPSPWTMADFADDCIGLIEAVCSPPVTVIGLSMGSLIAQQVAFQRPDLLRCAIAMGTFSHVGVGFSTEWANAEIAFREAGRELPRDFAIAHYATFMYPPEVLGDEALWAKVRPVVDRAYGARDAESLAAQWSPCVDFDSRTALASCQVPLHVVGFSLDVQTPPAWGKAVADAAPDGHFHLLAGLAHCSAFGHRPDLVNACLRGILEKHRGGDEH